MSTPLTRRAGATSKMEKRVTRRSKGARCDFLWLGLGESLALGLEPILFHPPVQRAAAQAECFRRLTHVALKALQCFANQNTFYGLQTQFFQILRLRALRAQPEVGGVALVRPVPEAIAFQGLFQLPHAIRPGILH